MEHPLQQLLLERVFRHLGFIDSTPKPGASHGRTSRPFSLCRNNQLPRVREPLSTFEEEEDAFLTTQGLEAVFSGKMTRESLTRGWKADRF